MEKINGAVTCPVCSVSHLPTSGQLSDGVYAATCEGCGHFFKFKVNLPVRSEVSFTVNGEAVTVGNEYDPATSLNEFLRDSRLSMGTKYMCREGGCGLCVVMATIYDPVTKKKKSRAINSCLCPVYMCDGYEITTIEGIGSLKEGLHPIQSRLDKYNGSQCGFCSPAQIMNMYALLKEDSEPSKKRIEDAFDGIICRCTGYRSILDAMKSFADNKCTSADIEDLGSKMCKKTGKPCSGTCSKPALDSPVHMVLRDAQWFKPTTLKQLYDLLREFKDKPMRLVFGSTGSGVYKDIGPWMYDVLIDLHAIEELYILSTKPSVQVGANITLTQMIEAFSDHDGTKPPYLKECVNFMKRIAHTNVRNAGSWAGNLMMKHSHPEFPSDIFVMLETLNAQIYTMYINGNTAVKPLQLLSTDMKGKVITHMTVPAVDVDTMIKLYKVAKRSQNAHSYVSGGFRFTVDKNNNFLVKGKPSIVFAGISKDFVHATQTEAFLTDNYLGDNTILSACFDLLRGDLNPDRDPLAGGVKYRMDLAIALFYRFVLHLYGEKAGQRLQSGSYPLERPLSSGIQSYETKKGEWPLTEPLHKLEGKAQVTGEAVYINDLPPAPGELHAAFAVTTVGNAKIASIDISAAMAMRGVVKVLLAKDIPGQNNAMPPPYSPEEVLCSGQVMYAGQAVAIVVADKEETAFSAARAVKVTYTDVKPPVLTIEEALKAKMIFPDVAKDIVVGDAEGAIAKSAHVISGSVQCGTQYHFSMETQISICIPTEDGMKVHASSQWIDYAQKSIAQVLGVPCASIDLEVKRLGGAYGSKISRNFAVAAACAVAAQDLNKPVRMAMNFHTNMENVGKRFPYLAKYQVGVTDEGKLNGVKVTYYCDCGYAVNDCTVGDIMYMGDNAYYCPNWHMVPVAVQTNTTSNTYCRAPASTPGIFVMETIMEHIAKTLGKDPDDLRQINLYQKNQVTPGGMTLTYCSISDLMPQIEQTAEVSKRKQEIKAFNQANRWKKKGISVVPLKYGVPWNSQNYGVNVAIYSQDGTVAVSHGGIEVGQGINTKAAQVCAFELGIPVDMVKVKPTNTLTAAGSCFTGSSVTSELVAKSIMNVCQELNDRMRPIRVKMGKPTWLELVNECYIEGIDLAAHSWFKPHTDLHYKYNSYGVTCTEVELDVLTGEHELSRVDILFDCGESINPFLDVGQVEGAFVMGIGYWLLEETIYDKTTGRNLTNGTWDYKPPSSKDIPIDFRIQLLKNAPNPIGILRSKACGEPPLCMSCSVLFALKHAVEAARQEVGKDTYFRLDGPATVEVIQQACLTDLESLKVD